MQTKRLLSILLLCAIVTSTLACGDAADESSGETTETSGGDTTSAELTGRDAVSDDLPEKDFGGATFTILNRTGFEYEFTADEETGDLMNDAVYKRNTAVEERFNIELQTHTVDCLWGDQATEFNNMLRSSVMSGDGAFDLVAGYAATIPGLVSDGVFMNWEELDYVDFTKPWWSKEVADELTINGKSFMITGDISLALWKGMKCIYFNKQLAEDYQIGDIYSVVQNGEWTLGKLQELTKDVYEDLDGDGIKSQTDRYGLRTFGTTAIDSMKESFEVKVTEKDENGFPEFVLNNERTIEVIDNLISYIHDSGFVFMPNDYSEESEVKELTMFSDGLGLFYTASLGNAETLRAMNDDFGILPYPKYDENQTKYHSTSHDTFSLIEIPIDAKDKEMSAIITEALCAESYKKVVPTFYDIVLKTKAARDDDSSAMIDIIRDGLIFDWGYLHSNTLGGVGHLFVTLIRDNNRNFVSEYNKNAATYEQKLEEALEVYQ